MDIQLPGLRLTKILRIQRIVIDPCNLLLAFDIYFSLISLTGNGPGTNLGTLALFCTMTAGVLGCVGRSFQVGECMDGITQIAVLIRKRLPVDKWKTATDAIRFFSSKIDENSEFVSNKSGIDNEEEANPGNMSDSDPREIK